MRIFLEKRSLRNFGGQHLGPPRLSTAMNVLCMEGGNEDEDDDVVDENEKMKNCRYKDALAKNPVACKRNDILD